MEKNEFMEYTKELIVKYLQIRKEMISQSALESVTGVPRQVIRQYEKGEVIPTVKAMNRILEPMGYKLDIVPIERENAEYESGEDQNTDQETDS